MSTETPTPPTEGAPQPAAAAPTPRRRAKGPGTGRVRSTEEIERAKLTATLTRRLNTTPELIKPPLVKALEKTGGRGPEMAEELQLAMTEEFGVKPALAAVRALLQRLRRLGVLELGRDGTANLWRLGSGKPARGGRGAKESDKAKPGKSAAKRGPGRLRKEVTLPKGKPGRPKKFRGTDAADRLVSALGEALQAAEALRSELDSVAKVKERVEDIIRSLR